MTKNLPRSCLRSFMAGLGWAGLSGWTGSSRLGRPPTFSATSTATPSTSTTWWSWCAASWIWRHFRAAPCDTCSTRAVRNGFPGRIWLAYWPWGRGMTWHSSRPSLQPQWYFTPCHPRLNRRRVSDLVGGMQSGRGVVSPLDISMETSRVQETLGVQLTRFEDVIKFSF